LLRIDDLLFSIKNIHSKEKELINVGRITTVEDPFLENPVKERVRFIPNFILRSAV
jgi:hypothetical protein